MIEKDYMLENLAAWKARCDQRAAYERLMERQQKCLSGEHEADSRHEVRAGTPMEQAYRIGCSICIHCRCLYVEKGSK